MDSNKIISVIIYVNTWKTTKKVKRKKDDFAAELHEMQCLTSCHCYVFQTVYNDIWCISDFFGSVGNVTRWFWFPKCYFWTFITMNNYRRNLKKQLKNPVVFWGQNSLFGGMCCYLNIHNVIIEMQSCNINKHMVCTRLL